MREIEISRINISKKSKNKITDFVSEDKPIHIFLNNRHYGTILCSPHKIKEMAIGHLISEGLLESANEIKNLQQKRDGKVIISLKDNINAENKISNSLRFSRLIISSCGTPNYKGLKEILGSLPEIKNPLKIKSTILSKSV